MKDHISISVSTIKGSRHFCLGVKAQQGIRWSILLLLITSVLVAASIVYLVEEVDFSRGKQEELELQSDLLTEDLVVLKQLKEELENDLNERESQLTGVAERLGELEAVLGVDADNKAPLESRLDVAEINSAVRVAFLRYLPNGAPVNNARQSSQYGKRKHPVTGTKRFHRGLDFAVNTGTPIYAPADGVVETVRPSNKGSGNFLRLQHYWGFTTSYSHLKKFAVRRGEFVHKGDLIGYSGNSGLSSGPHLHYEIRFVGRPLDPKPFVDWGITNFDYIFEKERKVKWVSLKNIVEQQVSMPLQLSSQKGATSQVSSS